MKNDKVRCEKCGKWISVCKMRRHKKKRCGIRGGRIQPVDTRRLIQLYLEMIQRSTQTYLETMQRNAKMLLRKH